MPRTADDGIVVGDPPSIRIDGPTLQPGHSALVGNGMSEADKYKKMWEHKEYRAMAPGEDAAHIFLSRARPAQGAEVIDFGAGTGRGALNLAVFGGMKVRMLDFAENCLDDDIRQMLVTQAHVMCFAKQDLNDPIPWTAEYGFCTDVMEHIPPRDVDRVLTNVLKSAQHVFFQISTVDDVCGALIGEPLHLSVHPYAWWLAKLQTEFECQVHWSQEFDNGCMFYVTAWWTGKKITENGILNCEEQEALNNVRTNTAREYRQVQPTWDLNDTECLVLGGGPSLDSQLNKICEMVADGCKVVTLNGAYNWAVKNNIQVGAQILVDAREFNNRFVQPIQEKCKYFIASQCHSSVYAYLEGPGNQGPNDGEEDDDEEVKRQVPEHIWQWHTTASFVAPVLVERFPKGYYAISGGSTVLLRALPLMRTMGFKMFHLFGCDSCLSESGTHHAFAQAENEGNMAIPVIVGGRTFVCHPWMASQASEFIDLVKYLGNEMEIEVHGGGLLAWILEHAASLDDQSKIIDAIESQAKGLCRYCSAETLNGECQAFEKCLGKNSEHKAIVDSVGEDDSFDPVAKIVGGAA